jgi:hypothetical protein
MLRPLIAVLILGCLTSTAFAATYYVSPTGARDAPGTLEAPLASVQAALDRCQPGDTVHVLPGVYRERVDFTAGGRYAKPVTLEGEPGAILDGSTPVDLQWEPATDIAPHVYRAKVPFMPFTVLADGKIITMLSEQRTDPNTNQDPKWQWPNMLRDGCGPSKFEGVKALGIYLRKSGELLVRFGDDRDPKTVKFVLAPREPVVRISGVDRCVVRGLALRNAAYGVFLNATIGSVVEDCTIGPVDYGVWLDSGADRCTIRFCEMFMDPFSGADPRLPGAWDNWQAHKTGGFSDRYGVQIAQSVGGHEIHDNLIHDVWDGIEDRGGPGENRGMRIHHNRILTCSDDGLEPNGAEEDCEWAYNVVEHCICGFRIKAPKVGPLYAHHNIFLSNSEDYRNFGEVELKPAWVYVYHNTCTAGAAIQSNKVYAPGVPNYHYFNNLFWCRYWWGNSGPSIEPNWKGDYNVFIQREKDRRWDQTKAIAARLGIDTHSQWLTDMEPGFTDFPAGDLSLTAASPARGRGTDLKALLGKELPGLETGATPDCGALKFGEPMPKLPRGRGDVQVVAAGQWPGPDAVSPEPTIGPSLLANGSFERAFEGWGVSAARAFAVREGDAYDGKSYVTITNSTGQEDLRQTVTGLEKGRTYALVYWTRRCTIGDLRMIVRNPQNAAYLTNGRGNSSAGWKRSILRFTAPGPEVSLEISARAPGTCDLDAVVIGLAN